MKKITALFLAVVLLLIGCSLNTGTGEGLSFEEKLIYKTQTPLTAAPRTFEVCLNKSNGESGVLVSNFGRNASVYFTLEIMPDDTVRLIVKNNTTQTVTFPNTKISENEWTRLSVTLEENNAVCYINGKKSETQSFNSAVLENFTAANPLCVGGDFRTKNSSFFKGEIRSVAVYSTAKSASKIKRNSTSSLDKKDLLCAFEFEKSAQTSYTDLSQNQNNLSYATDINSIEGADFTEGRPYKTMIDDFTLPKTFEVTLKIPVDIKGSAGTVLSTFTNAENPFYSISINEKEEIVFALKNGDKITNAAFKANLNTGEWEHIALVFEEKEIVCYLNSEEIGRHEIDMELVSSLNKSAPVSVGNQNGEYFKGKIAYLCAYSDTRNSDEIEFDMLLPTLDKDDLKYAFEFKQNGRARYEDLSDHGFTLTYNGRDLLDNTPYLEDYSYSFAVVGDTQIVNYYDGDKLVEMYDWIADNVDDKKIKYVFGLGDITDKSSEREWQSAVEGVSKLDGVVPYSIIRGNHDKSADFIEHFPYKPLGDNTDGTYDGTSKNTYRKFQIGDTKWLMLTLDFGPTDAIINWANMIIMLNPDYNVIVSTHRYIGHSGVPYPNDDRGIALWEKCISQHKNIVLTLSGHYDVTDVVISQKEGVNGNTVTQLMIDPQGEDKSNCLIGAVAMLYFSEDGKTVQIRNYSTLLDCYLGSHSQTKITLDLVD